MYISQTTIYTVQYTHPWLNLLIPLPAVSTLLASGRYIRYHSS